MSNDYFISLREYPLLRFLFEPWFLCILTTMTFLAAVIWWRPDANNLVISGSGAFFGTAVAFLLNITNANKKAKLDNIFLLRKTSYLIEKMLKINTEVKKHINSEVILENPAVFDWEKIRRFDNFFPIPDIEVKNLLFLIDPPEIGKETLDMILLVSVSNQTLVHVLEERNEKYATYLDKIENASYQTQAELEQLIGKRLCIELNDLTNRLKKINEDLLIMCPQAKEKIKEFLAIYR